MIDHTEIFTNLIHIKIPFVYILSSDFVSAYRYYIIWSNCCHKNARGRASLAVEVIPIISANKIDHRWMFVIAL